MSVILTIRWKIDRTRVEHKAGKCGQWNWLWVCLFLSLTGECSTVLRRHLNCYHWGKQGTFYVETIVSTISGSCFCIYSFEGISYFVREVCSSVKRTACVSIDNTNNVDIKQVWFIFYFHAPKKFFTLFVTFVNYRYVCVGNLFSFSLFFLFFFFRS